MRDENEDREKVPLSTFAAQRSHQHSNISYDQFKATAQAAILINGGSATALLAFMSSSKAQEAHSIVSKTPACLMMFALGVALGALMLHAMSESNLNWNVYWQQRATEAHDDPKARKRAYCWRWTSRVAFVASIGCFLFGSVYLASGFPPA